MSYPCHSAETGGPFLPLPLQQLGYNHSNLQVVAGITQTGERGGEGGGGTKTHLVILNS